MLALIEIYFYDFYEVAGKHIVALEEFGRDPSTCFPCPKSIYKGRVGCYVAWELQHGPTPKFLDVILDLLSSL